MTEIDRVVEATGEVFFTGFRTAGLGAKDRQLYRVLSMAARRRFSRPRVKASRRQ